MGVCACYCRSVKSAYWGVECVSHEIWITLSIGTAAKCRPDFDVKGFSNVHSDIKISKVLPESEVITFWCNEAATHENLPWQQSLWRLHDENATCILVWPQTCWNEVWRRDWRFGYMKRIHTRQCRIVWRMVVSIPNWYLALSDGFHLGKTHLFFFFKPYSLAQLLVGGL